MMTALDENGVRTADEVETSAMRHNHSVDTETEGVQISEADQYPFAKGVVSGTMSGTEMLADWEEDGCFDVWAEQYKDIGPGKKYADSTEYVNARRERTENRGLIDALITAAALSLNAPLCTFNVKHFRAVLGLITEKPYQHQR